MIPHGPWKIKSTSEPYSDPYVQVRLDQVVRPDGEDGQHVVVHIKPGVCVIAVDEKQHVHLTSEFHYGVGRISIEGVSGGIEQGELAESTAIRELQEELGLVADDWQLLTSVDPFTTILVSPTQVYLAQSLSSTDKSPEGTEQIETVVLPLKEAVEKVLQGEITHAPTCVGLLLAERQLLGSRSENES